MPSHAIRKEQITMTVRADAAAITPTNTAKAAIQAKGTDVNGLMTLFQTRAVELQILLRQIIALTPSGDANLTALNNLLSELL
jgi:hypothetical protein